MGQIGGTIGIVLGIVLLIGSLGAFTEASDLQLQHDQYCGGVMEALLDWDGNCEQLRDYISDIEEIGLVLGGVGLFFLILGIVELSSSGKKEKTVEVNYVPYTPQPAATVVRQSPGLRPSQAPSVSTSGFCSNCGTPFTNSEANFCNSCGSPR